MTAGTLYTHPEDNAREVADLPSLCAQAHAANLMVLHDGTLACVWFGGSMEGRSDISIYMSKFDAQTRTWSIPVQLSDDPERSEQNPILFPTPGGALWLLHTAQFSGNQDTSVVRRRISIDDGATWTATESVPGLASGTFVRHPIHIHTDGSWQLPAYACQIAPGQNGWQSGRERSITFNRSRSLLAKHPHPEQLGLCTYEYCACCKRTLAWFFQEPLGGSYLCHAQ